MEITIENPCPGQANGLSAYYFTQAVQMLLATHCTLGNPGDYPQDVGDSIRNDDEFDFIIVGGGSSGSVIANRLSEMKKWKILLIESGGNPTFESDIPGFGLSLPGRALDWTFQTNRSEKSCLGMEDETCSIFQGKVLGGTSTINNLHYLRGHPQDFNDWESFGNKGWSYEKVLPYFKKSEKLDEDFELMKDSDCEARFEEIKKTSKNDRNLYENSKMAVGRFHSKAGQLSVNHFAYDFNLSPLKKALLGAAEELQIPHIVDVSLRQIGFIRALGTLQEANRANAAKSFLTPIKDRKNLFVAKNATVQRLIFDGDRAAGVEFIRNGETRRVTVSKEVILSAGAINSPRLLLLSGIGPKEHLEKLGIEIVRDLQGVGENLQMHLSFFGLPVILGESKSKTLTHLQKIDAMYQFISRGIGPFGGIGMNDIVGFIDSNNNSTVPDIQFLHYLNHVQDYYTFNELLISLKIKNEIRDQFAKTYATSSILLICPTLLKPKSRGRIELSGPHFKHPPRIYSNFLQHKEDIETLIRGIKMGIALTETKAFAEFKPRIMKLEIQDCKKLQFRTNEYWECLIHHLASSLHDAAGTCKMGPLKDSSAVVDNSLKVHGVKGVRVADSSIMPSIVRGSTSIASTMIAEKVSDLIKKEWTKAKHTEL